MPTRERERTIIDDAELMRLRALSQDAEDRYQRLKTLVSDSATLRAALELWNDAAGAVRLYEKEQRERGG